MPEPRVRLVPATVTATAGGGTVHGPPRGPGLWVREELALACRLTMGLAMFAMLLAL